MTELLISCFIIGIIVLLLFSKDGREKIGALILATWLLILGISIPVIIGAVVLFVGFYIFSIIVG